MLLGTNLPRNIAGNSLIQLLFTTIGLSVVGAIYKVNAQLYKLTIGVYTSL